MVSLFNIAKNNLRFVASPFSIKAVELLKKLATKRLKLLREVNNYLMIDKITKLKKEIILSSGLSNLVNLTNVLKE